MRHGPLLTILLGASLACAASPASAQSGFDPATGTVCGLINFAFCPQGVPPAPLPDPEGDAERTARPAPAPAAYAPVRSRRHRTGHATVPRATDEQ